MSIKDKNKNEDKNKKENSNLNISNQEEFNEANHANEKKNNTENEKVEIVILPRGKRCIVFILFITMNIIVNMDNGTVPALIDQISMQLDIQKEIIGLFGSLQYGGNLIGN
jgi:hypothetical protein